MIKPIANETSRPPDHETASLVGSVRQVGDVYSVSSCVFIMDVPTLMYNLKEEVTCSICIHLYTNPKQLPCLHIFCLECLNNLARTSTRYGKIKCPICQAEVAVPETGTMEALPSCFYVKNLLDVLAIKECNTSKVTCGNCDEKRDEASYCFHCGKFWCKECLNAHNILKENKEHRVLSLKDFQDKDFEGVLKKPVFCQRELHDREVLKFYCTLCEVPVCQTCVIVEHSKHDVEHLEITARAVKNNIATKLDTAKESSKSVSSYIRQLEATSSLLKHRLTTGKERIQQTVESLISILRQKEHDLIAEVENRTKEAQDQIMKQKDESQELLNKREQSISQIECLAERSTGAELVRGKAFVDELFRGLQELQHVPSSSEQFKSPKTVFLKNHEISQFLQGSRIGHLDETATEADRCSVEGFQGAACRAGLKTDFQVITRNSQGEQYYCPGDYISVDVTSAQGALATVMKIIDNSDGSYTASFIATTGGPHKLCDRLYFEFIEAMYGNIENPRIIVLDCDRYSH